MPRLLDGYQALLVAIARVERFVVVTALAAIVVCIFAQVVSRYLFGRPLVWVEELSTYCFIWGTFLGASLGLKYHRHIRILSFVGRLAPGRQRLFRGVTDLAIAGFCVLLVVNGFQAMAIFEWRQRTIALPVELPRFLFYSTPLILGAASMTLTVLYDLVAVVTGRPPAFGDTAA